MVKKTVKPCCCFHSFCPRTGETTTKKDRRIRTLSRKNSFIYIKWWYLIWFMAHLLIQIFSAHRTAWFMLTCKTELAVTDQDGCLSAQPYEGFKRTTNTCWKTLTRASFLTLRWKRVESCSKKVLSKTYDATQIVPI